MTAATRGGLSVPSSTSLDGDHTESMYSGHDVRRGLGGHLLSDPVQCQFRFAPYVWQTMTCRSDDALKLMRQSLTDRLLDSSAERLRRSLRIAREQLHMPDRHCLDHPPLRGDSGRGQGWSPRGV